MLSLPNEVIVCIAEQLSAESYTLREKLKDWQAAVTTLSNLCLASRSMCRVAQPVLHRCFSRTYDISSKSEVNRLDPKMIQPRRLKQLLRTLLDRPDLASQMRSIRLLTFLPSIEPESEDEDSHDPKVEHEIVYRDDDLLDALVAASYKIARPDPQSENSKWHEDWRHNLAMGTDNAELALLLTLVPNLRVLDLETPHTTFGQDLHSLFGQVFGNASFMSDGRLPPSRVPSYQYHATQHSHSSSILPRLEKITLRHGTGAPIVDISQCLSMITIPTLTSCSLNGCWYDLDPDYAHPHVPLHNLRDLHLENMQIGSFGLRSIMEGCSNLRSLELVYSKYTDELVDVSQSFIDELVKVSGTLERLQFIIPGKSFRNLPDNLFDLRRLTKLKSLEMNHHPFSPIPGTHDPEPTLSDLLPASIENLILRWCEDDVIAPLSPFVDNQGYKDLPNLRYIELAGIGHFMMVPERWRSDRPAWFPGFMMPTHPREEEEDVGLEEWTATQGRCEQMCKETGIELKIWAEAQKQDMEDPDEQGENDHMVTRYGCLFEEDSPAELNEELIDSLLDDVRSSFI